MSTTPTISKILQDMPSGRRTFDYGLETEYMLPSSSAYTLNVVCHEREKLNVSHEFREQGIMEINLKSV
jgi:hypothetical protein